MARLMSITDKQRFMELEKRERFALKKLMLFLNQSSKKYTYEFHPTGLDSDMPYDAIVYIKDQDQNIVKKFLLEAKNRSSAWDDMFYEVTKHFQLKKTIRESGCADYNILYVNFTPEGCYMFPISEMVLPKMVKEEMKHETFAVKTRTRDKRVFKLDKKEAIHLPVFFNETEYLMSKEPVIVKIPEKKQSAYSLF